MGNECNACENVAGFNPGKLEQLEKEKKIALPVLPQNIHQPPPVSEEYFDQAPPFFKESRVKKDAENVIYQGDMNGNLK